MDRGWHSCPCGPKRCNPLLGNVAKVSLCLSAFERFLIPRSVPRTCDSTRLRMFDFVLGTSWRPLACWPSTDSSWCTRHFSKSAFVLACSCQSKCQTDMSEKEHIIYIYNIICLLHFVLIQVSLNEACIALGFARRRMTCFTIGTPPGTEWLFLAEEDELDVTRWFWIGQRNLHRHTLASLPCKWDDAVACFSQL